MFRDTWLQTSESRDDRGSGKSLAGTFRCRRGRRRKPLRFPEFVEPCHPTLREQARPGVRWIHEIKFDGYRTQAHLRNGRPAIYTRRAYCAVGKKPAITRRLGSNWRISPNQVPEESAGLMARKLKTYQTSLGFFDLAIAAPSMKAALQAWGSETNLFQQGFAKETDDPAIVAATLAKPGVVLRRPVGSDGAFSEHAELPKELPIDKVKERSAKPRATTSEPPAQKVDDEAAREAALAFERERKRRDCERRKEEIAREKERKRREQAIAKAEAALEEAKRDHETKVEEIERDRAALDRRSQAEDARWEKQKEKLETALRRARD